MNKRIIKDISYKVITKPIDALIAELGAQVATQKFNYFLAHADDGVIWGFVDGKTLRLSSDEYPDISPKLRSETLWEARLFGQGAQWHVWKSEGKWLSCTIQDGDGDQGRMFDEKYILWGTDEAEPAKNGFHPVREADLGIVHTPPVKMRSRHTLMLSMRHYLAYDDTGSAYVKISRLTNLSLGGG